MFTVSDLCSILITQIAAGSYYIMILDNQPSLIDDFNSISNSVKSSFSIGNTTIPVYINEFWTSKHRQASSIQEISYRACFKPQLPHFFINMLTSPDDTVYDPFAGRGTTAIESALMHRKVISNDVNPLSRILTYPRFFIPAITELEARLNEIPNHPLFTDDFDLSMFYHPLTESKIKALREYLISRHADGTEDKLDAWIRMAATNRLTGHSPGFFSVYTLPPNQAVSPDRQRKINQRRNQKPEYRDAAALICKKTKSLIRSLKQSDIQALANAGESALLINEPADNTCSIPDESVDLTVTSPPFLNVIQYSSDNWLRCWFNDINMEKVESAITISKTIDEWYIFIKKVFIELYRITRPGGWVAFEVGEVLKGKVELEEYTVPAGISAGFQCEAIFINQQEFTKTANIWGISNNSKGTNSNRIVLFRKRNK